MSVQLIISPPSAISSTTTGGGTEFIVDGNNFTTLNTTYSAEGTMDAGFAYAMVANPPTIPNTWYRYRNVSPAHSPNYLAYPTQSGNNVNFVSLGTDMSGYPTYEYNWGLIYQKMIGLVIGQKYYVTVRNNCVVADLAIRST